MSDFRYKWAAGNKLWVDIQENKDEYYIALGKHLVRDDPVNPQGNWFVLRAGRNVFMIMSEEDFEKYKESVEEERERGADFFSAVVKKNEGNYLFCWKKESMKEPVDDMSSWSFVRGDKNFFYFYPHTRLDWETMGILKKFNIISDD